MTESQLEIPATISTFCEERASDLSPHVMSPRLLGHNPGNHNMLKSPNSFRVSGRTLRVALRETGIVFALLIGALIFKEKLNLTRMAAATATFIGVVMIKIHW